jgi:hypothetical protein
LMPFTFDCSKPVYYPQRQQAHNWNVRSLYSAFD